MSSTLFFLDNSSSPLCDNSIIVTLFWENINQLAHVDLSCCLLCSTRSSMWSGFLNHSRHQDCVLFILMSVGVVCLCSLNHIVEHNLQYVMHHLTLQLCSDQVMVQQMTCQC